MSIIEYEEDLVADVLKDFKERQEKRRPLELQWRLNMNFLMGNQFCSISPRGDVEDIEKQYFWQEREVFNHIAPIVETRLSKLARVKAKVCVRPSTSDEKDVNSAKFSTAVLDSICKENHWSELMSEANMWSETTGSVFYKVIWDCKKGKVVNKKSGLSEGDVSIAVCPPFEIFPENLAMQNLDKQNSLIHAKVMSVDEIKTMWGEDIEGEKINVFSLGNAEVLGGFGYNASVPKMDLETKKNSAIVIEKYEKPNFRFPNGRLIIVAGNKLLFCGDLPFVNSEDSKRGFPFVKQTCIDTIGGFFGTSIIERIIPVQRTYNTVKNRKHEYMNRIAMGILAVEDGSVDIENLEEEGLSPGKILIYRQGSTPPVMFNSGGVPNDFQTEESRLLQEFVMISGVSEVTTYSKLPSTVTSGTAISLLLQQDDTKISLTADSLRSAVREVGKHILRLYKQFGKNVRLKRIAGENGDVEMKAFCSNDIESDDLVFETANELEDTLASRKAMVLELYKMGLLTDSNGVLSNRTKTKIFEILGFGNWEDCRDLDEYHIKKAMRENEKMESEISNAMSVDSHKLHIDEHIKLLVSNQVSDNQKLKDRLLAHIKEHNEFLMLSSNENTLIEKFEEEET